MHSLQGYYSIAVCSKTINLAVNQLKLDNTMYHTEVSRITSSGIVRKKTLIGNSPYPYVGVTCLFVQGISM